MAEETKNPQDIAAIRNSGHLCSVYCPSCGKVTDKISFNLLRDAGEVDVHCHSCGGVTPLEYKGKKVIVWHHDEVTERIMEDYILAKRAKQSQRTGKSEN